MPTLPGVQGQTLEEGIRPRDNAYTRSAERLLDEAQSAETDAEKADLYAQALQATQDCMAEDVDNPKCFFLGAQANVGLKDFMAADSMFDKAEELHPRYILQTEPLREMAWVDAYNEAIVPLNAGDVEASLEVFEAADAIYSERHEAILQMGSLYTRLGRYEEAADAYHKTIGILENNREVALADTAQAPTWEEHWGIARSGLAQALQLSGQYQEAADLLNELIQENPDDASLIGNLATVLTELEMTDSVDALYDNLLNRPGLTEFELTNAGIGLYRIEEYDRAAEAFRMAADMNPFNRDARVNLANTYLASEDWEAFIPVAEEVLEVDPLNGTIRVFMARAYSELENDEEAGRVFNEYQTIGYEIESIQLTGGPSGGATVSGLFKNNTAEPGGTVTLRFHFGGADTREIGTLDIRVQIPAAEESVEFTGEFSSSEPVTGYMYEVVG
jgi:tetratricopeptide (TPR) repeat protein